jgi:aminopeptidase N
MWFGNLVTMRWWNDLWLNESFATFMSFLAMAHHPELQYLDTVWVTFLTYKFWGISTDCSTSVHPIFCEINVTNEAESIFDGISYGKGSSWLKQTYYMIGHDVMSKGLATYFSRHAW